MPGGFRKKIVGKQMGQQRRSCAHGYVLVMCAVGLLPDRLARSLSELRLCPNLT